MKEKKIYDALTNIPDELVEEARQTKLKKRADWKKWTALAACAVVVLGIGLGIGLKNFPQVSNITKGALANVVAPMSYAFNDHETKLTVFQENPVEDSFLTAINNFSYQTASQVLTSIDGNANYSPISLYYALSLAASGANGETADELLVLLGISDQEVLSQQCGNLYRRLYLDNEIGKLEIGNSLWMDKNVAWKDGFINNAAENFYAESFSVDFTDEETAQDMAKWVKDNTHGTLNPEMEIDAEQILSILNTVYFYDEWIDKFDTADTKADLFYLADELTVNCDFMNRTDGSHAFATGDGFTRSSLSLKNAGSMIFILPDEGVSPRELLSTPERTKEVFESGEDFNGEVVWKIPKFSFSSKFDLLSTLQSLGINAAFEEDADFSRITDQTAFISKIHQETHIGIDEIGVEASAFTQIDYAGSAQPLGRADMILNRPFIYGITASDGTLLFVGICDNPSEG